MKKSELRELIKEQVRKVLTEADSEEATRSDVKYIPNQDKISDSDLGLSRNKTYYVIPINAPEPQYEEVQYNGKNRDTGEYDFTFGPNITGATGLTLKYTDRANRVWTSSRNSKPDTIVVKDEEVAKNWVAGKYNGGY